MKFKIQNVKFFSFPFLSFSPQPNSIFLTWVIRGFDMGLRAFPSPLSLTVSRIFFCLWSLKLSSSVTFSAYSWIYLSDIE